MKDRPEVDGILEFMSDSSKALWHKNWQSYTEEEAPSVHCYPFGALISLAGIWHMDAMFLDVEGGELSVLQSVPFGDFKVDVMVIEAIGREPEREARVRAFMADVGYQYTESWGRSDWFVRRYEGVPNPWGVLPLGRFYCASAASPWGVLKAAQKNLAGNHFCHECIAPRRHNK
ncbi:hypothetical protein Vafri_9240 [Volvox africanus]|uniref:Methyltransferase FkbM domain-containing protein n=1 Tax=Volvox africanus TaxID=51714 RepID=A0A8J4B3Y2_9CHLO|nr:hypothetical protein Vafri_9240 [Volvox africanus]